MLRVGIVDPGVGSICSTQLAFARICAQLASPCDVQAVSTFDQIKDCDSLVLAPHGIFSDVAPALERSGLAQAIREHVDADRPLFAIDLGLQMLFDKCEGVPGLGILAGEVVPMVPTLEIMSGLPSRIPHVGWNRLMLEPGACPVIEAAGRPGTWVYFEHGMKVLPRDKAVIAATTEHGSESIVSAVCLGSLTGTQFRPERSQRAGIRMMVAFLGETPG